MKSHGKAGSDTAGSPGATIRAIRLGKGLTLAQMKERTGLAVSTLSKLEVGAVSLSYDKLMLLSKGLGVDMASLVDPKPQVARGPGLAAGRRTVQRSGEGQLVETRSYRQMYLATELLNKKMTPMFVEIRAESLDDITREFGGLIHHPGEEFTLVVEGELDFHSELYAPVRLRAGDSVYFDSEMGHAYVKASREPCRLVCTCTPRDEGDAHLADLFVEVSNRNGEQLPLAPAAAAAPALKRRAAARPRKS